VKSASRILLLKAGRQQVFGDYSDLLSKGIDFIKFLPANEITGGNQENVTEESGYATSSSDSSDAIGENHHPVIPAVTRVSLSRQQSSVSRASIRSNVSRNSGGSISRMTGTRMRTESWRLGSILNVAGPLEGPFPSPAATIAAVPATGDEKTGVDGDTDADNDAEQSMENSEKSVASAKSYGVYLHAGGGCTALLIIMMFMGSTQILFTFSDWWLSVWTDHVETMQKYANNSEAMHHELNIVLGDNQMTNIYIYTGQTVLIIILAIARTIIFFIVCMRSSVRLHDRLFQRLSRAPMFFFDNNPVGILLNRCSRDMGIIDDVMPATMFDAMSTAMVDVGCAIMICIIDTWIMLPTAAVLLLSYLVRKLYIQTARGVKRLEGVTRSPVFTHMATSLKGISTIRAFNAEHRFNVQFDVHQDNHSAAWFHFLSCSRWFGVTLDWLCFFYILAITISMLAKLEKGSNVGLVITSAILLQSGYQWAIRQTTEVETQMTSVERVDEYSHLESEGLLISANPLHRPKKQWPTAGAIEFDNVSMKYSPRGNFVLQNLKISIRPREKVGIVGRTGAGKSSIINALFRLTECCEGCIIIDGIDISRIGLHELRKKISIIPQEPVLFSGSIRKNLDPFNEKSDGKVWRALDEVHLRETVQDISKGLEAITSEEKQHFSVGQRQLLCLARAILRGNRVRLSLWHKMGCRITEFSPFATQILILDEATANVDPKYILLPWQLIA
jgi:ATP-binding cassette subfamily C (CFTR/MRP) protein 4